MTLDARATALRASLEAGALDEHTVRTRAQRLGLALLAAHPADTELFEVFTRLRDRGFLPPAPLALPAGPPEAVAFALARRTPDEVAALAASIGAAPEPSAPHARTIAEVWIAARDPRAENLLARFERDDWSALAKLRLALADGTSPQIDLDSLSPAARAEALARLLAATLRDTTVYGAQWLVPVAGDRFVANLALATARRPALATAFGELVPRLLALQGAAEGPLAEAERLDQARRYDEAQARYATALDEADAQHVLSARAALLEGAYATWPPLTPADLLPSTDLEQALLDLVAAHPVEGASALVAAALRERLGDRAGAARAFAALADHSTVAAAEAVRLAADLPRDLREALARHLAAPELEDEVTLNAPELASRAALSLRLSPDPLAAARLFAVAPPPPPEAAPTDPHHPAQRLAAASDLLAEERLEQASNVLGALLKKAEPGTPERLFAVVAAALEHDEPPEELLAAARKALEDPPRARRLIAALRRSATAAFALHEELLGLAKDPSRPDPLRLSALECWLNIWAATTTPPNADLLATLRETEPALIAAAATAIGATALAGDPVEALGHLLQRTAEASGPAFSDALLDLMLGR